MEYHRGDYEKPEEEELNNETSDNNIVSQVDCVLSFCLRKHTAACIYEFGN
jgi:adenylylsulfate kinase-like enzyme